MDKLCTFIGVVIAKPEKREELHAILSAQVEPTRTEAGRINNDFHVDAEDPCTFIFYENWVSQEALDLHLKMPHLKPLMDNVDGLLARPVEIRFLDMLSERGG